MFSLSEPVGKSCAWEVTFILIFLANFVGFHFFMFIKYSFDGEGNISKSSGLLNLFLNPFNTPPFYMHAEVLH